MATNETNGGTQGAPNGTSQSIWASNTTIRSFRMVISDEEMKKQLQNDIADMKKEVYEALKATVITPATDPSYEAIWAHESKLKTKLNRTIETFKSMFGSDPLAASKALPIPPNLSIWQWKNKVFDKAKHIYETPDECVSDFESVLLAHKRPIPTYWKEYLITVLPGSILTWYNQLIEQKPETTWDDFKLSFIEHYGISPIVQKEMALSELTSMKYHYHEESQEYIQRFHDLRVKAKMEDIDTLKWCLTDPLPPRLIQGC
jgi:hypothetical protein